MTLRTKSQTASNRAAVYLRVSTEEQTHGYGLDDQRNKCADYARLYDFSIVETYADEGISGTKDEGKRPGLAALIDAANNGNYDVLIVPALDRIARRASLQLRILDDLEAHSVVIHSVKERIDTSTPAGRLLRTVLAGVAEMERDVIVERTTGGRNQRGKRDGEKGGKVPYGYVRVFDQSTGKAVGIRVVNDEAAIVRRVFELHEQGLRLAEIAGVLQASSVSPNGATWTPTAVWRILQNEAKYTGIARNDSTVHWPMII